MKHPCPACGDPNAYLFWASEDPPDCCPEEPERKSGICAFQRKRAEQRASWRKQFPEQFDTNGNILPGGLAHILERLPADTVLII